MVWGTRKQKDKQINKHTHLYISNRPRNRVGTREQKDKQINKHTTWYRNKSRLIQNKSLAARPSDLEMVWGPENTKTNK